jgi:hypothetical protein
MQSSSPPCLLYELPISTTFIYLIILIMLEEGYKLWSSSLCNFRYHKKQMFSVQLQWPLVSQESHWAMNRILSNDLDGCREENLYKTALMN